MPKTVNALIWRSPVVEDDSMSKYQPERLLVSSSASGRPQAKALLVIVPSLLAVAVCRRPRPAIAAVGDAESAVAELLSSSA